MGGVFVFIHVGNIDYRGELCESKFSGGTENGFRRRQRNSKGINSPALHEQ